MTGKFEGMYLLFDDGRTLDLSFHRIRDLSEKFWSDTDLIPQSIREDAGFKACGTCPVKKQHVFCSALKPLLLFLGFMDHYPSYASLTAVYIGPRGKRSHLRMTAAGALQFIAHVGLFQYCEYTKKYALFFHGIEPLSDPEKTIDLIALNSFWLNKGNMANFGASIEEIRHSLLYVGQAMAKRLCMISSNDAFINAFVSVQAYPEILSLGADSILDKYFLVQTPEPAEQRRNKFKVRTFSFQTSHYPPSVYAMT